ncbi:MAG: hypothetical protein VKL39_04120 [Leptolyngbyaceae bacterium]|nr:hypothetical protein [Leptolyngbyaceae bacterium]
MQERPLITIVGSANQERASELGLKKVEIAQQAAKELGWAIAEANCRLLVYSTQPGFIEYYTIRGYIESGQGKPNSIQIRYPLTLEQPELPDQNSNEHLFDWRPDRSKDWEVSFYRSLQEVDGMILIGGGQSTLISGLVAMGYRKPILALASFGGCAEKVWEALSIERDLLEHRDITFMASPKWSSTSAKEGIQILLRQRQRREEEAKQLRLAELRKSANLTRHALVSATLFLVALASVPIAWGGGLPYPWLLWLLFFSPVLGGVSGATIRTVFDLRQGSLPLTTPSTITTIALGLIAGGVAGLLFISAQLTAIPAVPDVTDAVNSTALATASLQLQASQAGRLVPFAVSIGFIAGLTLDAVFRRLLSIDVVSTDGIISGSSSEA